MKILVLVFVCFSCGLGAPPTLKNCNPNAAGKAVDMILHGGSSGNDHFTPLSKLLVKFKLDRTFSSDAKVHVKIDLSKKMGILGYVRIPNMVYGFLARQAKMPPGIQYVKDNEFLVTCDALTTNNVAMCPPKIGHGTAFVDLHPVYKVLEKFLNSSIGKYIADGDYKVHAEATVVEDQNFAAYPLACVDVTATSVLHLSK